MILLPPLYRYSLLGASGGGKTTILSAIVGLKSIDSGEIRVFGKVPGSRESGVPGKAVGHMPQEYSLYVDLTIQESINYFGNTVINYLNYNLNCNLI